MAKLPNVKVCTKCKFLKPLSEFHRDRSQSDGYAYKCKKCKSKISKKRYYKNVEESRKKARKHYKKMKQSPGQWDKLLNRAKKYRLKTLYGMTLNDWNELFTRQSGCCAVCGKHQSELYKGLAVDHCHISGKIRGLLCDNCNRALGLLQDDNNIVENLLNYVRKI